MHCSDLRMPDTPVVILQRLSTEIKGAFHEGTGPRISAVHLRGTPPMRSSIAPSCDETLFPGDAGARDGPKAHKMCEGDPRCIDGEIEKAE